jgi:flagellar capping protein FliD
MATVTERLGIVETKVENLNEKIDDIKVDIKDVHDCLDQAKNDLKQQLNTMYDTSCAQHTIMSQELSKLKSERDKWVWTGAGILIIISWIISHLEIIKSIIGNS